MYHIQYISRARGIPYQYVYFPEAAGGAVGRPLSRKQKFGQNVGKGRWFGPALCLAPEGQNNYYLSFGGSLIKATAEQLRPATSEEKKGLDVDVELRRASDSWMIASAGPSEPLTKALVMSSMSSWEMIMKTRAEGSGGGRPLG